MTTNFFGITNYEHESFTARDSQRTMELKTSFSHTAIEPFFSGGSSSIVDGLLATTYGERVILTDLETEQRVLTIDGDGEVITTLKITPDRSHLIVCSRSLQMRIFSLPDGALTRSVKAHESPVMALAVDPTSTLVATGGAEGRVKVWDIAGGYSTHDLHGHGGIVSALAFWGQRGGTEWKLASGSDDTKVRLWDLVKKKCVGVLDNHVSMVRGLEFSADGNTLLSAGRDKVVSVWDVSGKKPRLKQTIPVMESLEAVGYVDADMFYTGGEQGIVRLRSTVDGTLLVEEDKAVSAEDVSCVTVIFCPQQKVLYSVLSDQVISELSVYDSLKQLRCLAGNHGEIIDCCFLNTPSRMALCTNSTDLRIINLERRLEAKMLVGHSDIIIALDRSFDGRYVATAAKDNEARVWDVETGDCVGVFKGHAGSIGAIGLPRAPASVSKGSHGLPEFLVTGSQDLTVKLWNIAKGQTVYTRKAHDKDINAIDVSPDDRMFASGVTGEVFGVSDFLTMISKWLRAVETRR
jgi:U3 small nucleolar RNA-associated protein 13